jgi:hypothetical protein
MRLYIHSPGTAEVTVIEDVAPDTRVDAVVEVVEGDYVFLDDDDEPINVQLTIAALVQNSEHGDRQHHHQHHHHHHHHVHHHPCLKLEVGVVYNGQTKSVPAVPGTLIETVLLRALAAFEIDPVTGADLVLRLPGSDDDLPGSKHVGELIQRGSCSVTLNLLPGHREAG